MRLSLAISRLNYSLRGTDDDAPAPATEEWYYWVDTLNRKKDELYSDINNLWAESHETRESDTISAGEDIEIELESDFLAPSSKVFVRSADGTRKTYFDVVKPQEVDPNKQQVYIEGLNPSSLKFTKEILADDVIVGGTLFIPGYFMPADVNNASQDIPFPDPNWGIMAAASEIAFNDIVYETKASDLNEKAKSLYRQMVQRNRRGTYGQPRKIPRNMKRITSFGRR